MSRMEPATKAKFGRQDSRFRTAVRERVILVVEDGPAWSGAIGELCEFLDVRVEHLQSEDDLGRSLRDLRPMAVLADREGAGRDCCHVLKLVGAHDPELPVLVLTGGDPVIAGAAEAIQDVMDLAGASFVPAVPSPGELAEFLFRAGQRGRCLGLLPS